MQWPDELKSELEKLLPEVVILRGNDNSNLIEVYREIQEAYKNSDVEYLTYMLKVLENHKRFMLWHMSKWIKLKDDNTSITTLTNKMKQEFILKIKQKEQRQDTEKEEVETMVEEFYF